MMDQLAVSVAQAARMLSVSPSTIRRYIKTNKIAATKIGSRVILPTAQIFKLLDTPEERGARNANG
jgi:excisionase family DNA binding protein